MQAIHHRYADIDGHQLFYREAGAAGAPALVLLHGFPASSFMFRNLIPLLADRYHVIAPDHLGFGLSDAPPVGRVRLHLRRAGRADRGPAGPAGGHAVRHVRPGLRRAGGLAAGPGRPGRDLGDHHPERQRLRGRLRRGLLEAGAGVLAGPEPADRGRRPPGPDPGRHPVAVPARRARSRPWSAPTPGTTTYALVSRPGNDLVQLDLFADYASNLAAVPEAARLPARQPGAAAGRLGPQRRDLRPGGALAFADDAPGAEIHLLDGGHFLLESHLDTAAATIRRFLERTLS